MSGQHLGTMLAYCISHCVVPLLAGALQGAQQAVLEAVAMAIVLAFSAHPTRRHTRQSRPSGTRPCGPGAAQGRGWVLWEGSVCVFVCEEIIATRSACKDVALLCASANILSPP